MSEDAGIDGVCGDVGPWSVADVARVKGLAIRCPGCWTEHDSAVGTYCPACQAVLDAEAERLARLMYGRLDARYPDAAVVRSCVAIGLVEGHESGAQEVG